LYPDDKSPQFEALGYDSIFMGHTHRQHLWTTGAVEAVNVGSCGQPRDMGNMGGFGVYDTCESKSYLYRIEFDVPIMLEKYSDVHNSVRQMLSRRECVTVHWSKV
jgi:hypothetical protein